MFQNVVSPIVSLLNQLMGPILGVVGALRHSRIHRVCDLKRVSERRAAVRRYVLVRTKRYAGRKASGIDHRSHCRYGHRRPDRQPERDAFPVSQ